MKKCLMVLLSIVIEGIVARSPRPAICNQPVAGEIETLVDRIIDMKKNSQDTTDLENQIDQLVYRLYGLTPEEIEVVEGSDQN